MNNETKQHLTQQCQPQKVWQYFAEIIEILETKGKDYLCQYLKDFFIQQQINDVFIDQNNNITVHTPAHPECKNWKMYSLETNLDVCASKESFNASFNIEQNYLQIESKEKLHLNSITAIALIMTLLKDKNIKHGPLEIIFMIDKKQKLLPPNINGDYLINLNGQNENVITVGSCGNCFIKLTRKIYRQKIRKNHCLIEVVFNNYSNYESPIDAMGSFLLYIKQEKFRRLQLVQMRGGSFFDFFSNYCRAQFIIPRKQLNDFRILFNFYVKKMLIPRERKLKVKSTLNYRVLDYQEQTAITVAGTEKIICSLVGIDDGDLKAYARKTSLPNCNIGTIETKNNVCTILFRLCTPRNKILRDIIKKYLSMSKWKKWTREFHQPAPSWINNINDGNQINNDLIETTQQISQEIFGKKFQESVSMTATEIPNILQANPNMLAISIGPTIKRIDAMTQQIDLLSVNNIYIFLTKLIGTES